MGRRLSVNIEMVLYRDLVQNTSLKSEFYLAHNQLLDQLCILATILGLLFQSHQVGEVAPCQVGGNLSSTFFTHNPPVMTSTGSLSHFIVRSAPSPTPTSCISRIFRLKKSYLQRKCLPLTSSIQDGRTGMMKDLPRKTFSTSTSAF